VIAEPKEVVEEPPPIQDAARQPGAPGQPGGIMAPASNAAPAAIQPVPRPPAVQSAPLQQPRRPAFSREAPLINSDR
jgi:hypothetical protein